MELECEMLEGFIDATALLRSGIYALLYNGVVVYVGQSKTPLNRIYAHRSLRSRTAPAWLPIKGMLFDEVHVLPCSADRLDLVEKVLIDLYKPKYNVKLKSPQPIRTEFNVVVGTCVLAVNVKGPSIVRRF